MIKLIDNKNFNKIIDNKQVNLFTLKNENGMACQVTNFGGRIVSLWVEGKDGNFDDVVLGYESIDDYLSSDGQYYGAIIGRFANRIENGRFNIEDAVYNLFKSNEPNHLHGGKSGYNNKVWDAKQVSNTQLELSYISVDGEEGYPGNLSVKATFTLKKDNSIEIKYTATTDKTTPVNLSHHSFFNLNGIENQSILEHQLKIHAGYYTPINNNGIPTGNIESVKNTPLDFTKLKPIGKHINDTHLQLKHGSGYDHNFVLDGNGLKLAAQVIDPKSGRIMDVITNEPGLQFYTSNFLNGKDIGKENTPFNYRCSFCLETQHYPNSPNQLNFPTTLLPPKETYNSICIYKFSLTK